MSRTQRIAAGVMAVWIAAIVVGVVLLHHGTKRATVPEVSAAASKGAADARPRALARTIDGLGFPDFSSLGWTVQGGRADTVGGRRTGTVYYLQTGGRTVVAYTLVSGSGSLDDATTPWVRKQGGVTLSWQTAPGASPAPAALVGRFTRRGHAVVLTGRPVSEALRAKMTAMAVASASAP